jgi:hypothetical protein
MVDVSKLVISVDSDGAKVGGLNLEKLAKAGEKAEKSTDSLDVSVVKLTKHFEMQARNAGKSAGEIKILELKAKGATDAQLKAAQAALENAEAMKMQADQARFAAKSAGATGGAFRAMRGSTQQLSWQLQDVAVQAQMGTSAFMIMGQQGPQIASIFGSGGAVLGALIAFGSILAGAVYNSLNDTGDAMEKLKETNKSLIDSFDDLTEVQKKYARSLAQTEIAENNAQIRELQQELNQLKDIRLNFSEIFSLDPLTFEERHKEIERIEADIVTLGKKNKNLVRQTDDTTDATEDLIKKLKQEKAEIGANSVVLAYQEAVRAGANDEQLRSVVLLAAQNLAAEEALEKTEENNKAVDKAKEQQKKYNANLQHQLNLLTLTGPALDAYKASVKGGTEEQQKANAELERQIRLKKEAIALDKKIADNEDKLTDFFKKANEKKDADAEKAEEDAQKRAAAEAQRGLDKITLLALQHEAARIQLADDLAKEYITQQQHDEALKGQARETANALSEIDKKALADKQAIADAKAQIEDQGLQNAQNVASGLGGIAEEGTAAQKALFAVSKAIAIAEIIVATERAAALAAVYAAGAGPIAWLASREGIRIMGYASAGIVAGTAIAGGRALGGQVRGGESYLVGERGPELLTMGTSGRIATNENLKNAVGGNSGSAVTVNQTINVTTGIQSTVRAEIVTLMPQIAQAAKGAVADARLRGGNFSKAMSGA